MYIRPGAFAGCSGLTSIKLPASVEYIGEDAFDGCTKLSEIIYEGTVEPRCYADLSDTAVSAVQVANGYEGDKFCAVGVVAQIVNEDPDNGLTGGAIAGIVIGCVVGVALIAAAVLFFLKRREVIDLSA